VAPVLLAGCYHATIETGLPPSAQVIDQTFASAWIYGLVPPKTVTTASKCPSGVAKVETEHSFVNQLVGILTLGIYTPMHIKVTCAAASSASGDGTADHQTVSVEKGADAMTIRAQFAVAAARAAEAYMPVLVQFEGP
jgi:hypothetical protein